MRVEYVVPGFIEHRAVEDLVEATGLPWEVVQEHLKGYLEATVELTLIELRASLREQEEFTAYVMAEMAEQTKATASVGAPTVALTQLTQGF